MSARIISLYQMPDVVMVILGLPTGVLYENQVCGNACLDERYEGALAPLGFKAPDAERLMSLPFPSAYNIDNKLADMIDEILSGEPYSQYLKVDRSRLHESYDAWVHVLCEITEDSVFQPMGPYMGAPRGFGPLRGVLTWPNSD